MKRTHKSTRNLTTPETEAASPAQAEAIPTRKRQARREETEARLIAAIGKIIEQQGVAALGINQVAEVSGVNKALIYRYFGGLPELMRAYGESADFWPSVEEVLDPAFSVLDREDPAKVTASVLGAYARAIRKRPITLALLAGELNARNELTVVLEEVREARTQALFKRLRELGLPLSPDLMAFSSFLAGAIHYLAIRSRTIRRFGGLNVETDEDWNAIAAFIERAVRPFF